MLCLRGIFHQQWGLILPLGKDQALKRSSVDENLSLLILLLKLSLLNMHYLEYNCFKNEPWYKNISCEGGLGITEIL